MARQGCPSDSSVELGEQGSSVWSGEDARAAPGEPHGATVRRLCAGKRNVKPSIKLTAMAGINPDTLGLVSPRGCATEEMHDCYESPRGPGGGSSLPMRSPRPSRGESFTSDEAMTRLDEEVVTELDEKSARDEDLMSMLDAKFAALEERLLQNLEKKMEKIGDQALDLERVQSLVDRNIDIYHSHLQELLPAKPADTQLDVERVQDLIDQSLDVYNSHVVEKILHGRSQQIAAHEGDEVEMLEAKAENCITYMDNLEHTVMSLRTALQSKDEEMRSMLDEQKETGRPGLRSPRSVALSPRTPSCSFAGTLEEELTKTKIQLEQAKSQKELADQWSAFLREKHDNAVEMMRAARTSERMCSWRDMVLVVALVLALCAHLQSGPPTQASSMALASASSMAKFAFPNILGLAAWGLSTLAMTLAPKRPAIQSSRAVMVDQNLTAAEVANTLLSWSEVVPAPNMLEVMGGKALKVVENFTAEDVTKTFVAYRQFGKTPEPVLYKALTTQARTQVGSFDDNQVSLTLNSLSALGEVLPKPRPQTLLKPQSVWKLMTAGWRLGNRGGLKKNGQIRYFVTAHDVAAMILDLVVIGRKPPQELLESMRKCFIEVNAHFSAEEIEKTLWAFAELQEAPGPALLNALRARAVTVARSFTAPEAKQMMLSFAKLGTHLFCPLFPLHARGTLTSLPLATPSLVSAPPPPAPPAQGVAITVCARHVDSVQGRSPVRSW